MGGGGGGGDSHSLSVTCRTSVVSSGYSGFLLTVKPTFYHHPNHGLDMTLAVAEALTPNKPNL